MGRGARAALFEGYLGMDENITDYHAAIGRLTIASATLEEVVIRWGALLSEGNLDEIRYKRLLLGLEKNLTFLACRVEERVSGPNQQEVLDMIERARGL